MLRLFLTCCRIFSRMSSVVCVSSGLMPNVNSTTRCIETSMTILNAASCSTNGYSWSRLS